MTLSPSSSDLLAAVPEVLEGVVVQVLGADGCQSASFGSAVAGERSERRFDLPDGQVLATYPAADPALNQPDFIHPTAEGYAIVVENLLPYVEQAIAQVQQPPD